MFGLISPDTILQNRQSAMDSPSARDGEEVEVLPVHEHGLRDGLAAVMLLVLELVQGITQGLQLPEQGAARLQRQVLVHLGAEVGPVALDERAQRLHDRVVVALGVYLDVADARDVLGILPLQEAQEVPALHLELEEVPVAPVADALVETAVAEA